MTEVRAQNEESLDAPRRPRDERKRRRGRALRVVGLAFILAALVLGGYVWWQLWGTGFATRAAQNELRPEFERRVATVVPQDAPARVLRVPGDAIAIIKIPKLEVDLVVVEGTDTESLKRGPGHYSKTSYPWEDTGTTAIAGHRTTYGAPFWSLNELRKGDKIVLQTEYGIFEYRVTGLRIIEPSDGSVLEDTRSPTLVLTTCTPRFSSAERLIIFADRVG